MNWKVQFRELTNWRPKNNDEPTKNDEERWKIFAKSPTETSQKRYGSGSAWIFFTETIFLTNFKLFSDTRRVEPFLFCPPSPIYREKREELATQLAQASSVASSRRHHLLVELPGRPKWAWFLFAHPFILNTPSFTFFYWFLFRNVTELYGLCNDAYFLSGMSRNFSDYATMPFLTFGMLQNFTNCAIMLPFDFWHVVELYGLCNNASFRLPTCRGTSRIA